MYGDDSEKLVLRPDVHRRAGRLGRGAAVGAAAARRRERRDSGGYGGCGFGPLRPVSSRS
ncbi:hypothetical protein GCM10023405_34370 [Streptomonospora salina]